MTTILDLAGILLLILAGSLFAAAVLGAPAGLAVGGVGLLGLSWLVDHSAKRKDGGK